jgi:hypothetical protein
MIVDSVLWVYYANMPALFYPCDLMRRFGCNPPVGILVDKQLVSIVKRTLSGEDYAEFHREASGRFEDLQAFVESRPVLDDEAVLESYGNTREPMPKSAVEAWGRTLTHLRAMKEMMAWSQANEGLDEGIPPMPTRSLAWWTKAKEHPL